MAKDDFFVIAYQVLSYLYQCMKSGTDIEEAALRPESKLFRVNENYWKDVLRLLIENGYIDGCRIEGYWGGYNIECLERTRITLKGIEYLTDNSFIQKAKRLLKDINSISPFKIG